MLGASLLAVACTTRSGGPPTSSQTSTLAVLEIPNPAAPGSGEASLTSLADGRAVLSWIEPAGKDAHAVRLAVLRGGQAMERAADDRAGTRASSSTGRTSRP